MKKRRSSLAPHSLVAVSRPRPVSGIKCVPSPATRVSGASPIRTMPASVWRLTIRRQFVPAVVAGCWLMTKLIERIPCLTCQSWATSSPGIDGFAPPLPSASTGVRRLWRKGSHGVGSHPGELFRQGILSLVETARRLGRCPQGAQSSRFAARKRITPLLPACVRQAPAGERLPLLGRLSLVSKRLNGRTCPDQGRGRAPQSVMG